MSTSSEKQYQHLEARPGSVYKQLWLKGRRIRTGHVWEIVHSPDYPTPEEVAEDYRIPIEAIREALDYVEHNMELIEQERQRDTDRLRAMGIKWPPDSDGDSPSEP
jgi:uncharacterized protein (DUF433 family)